MKSAFLKEINRPIVVEESDVPEPAGDEIIVKQNVTGICFRDILTKEGFMPRVRLPIIPGHEIAGTISSIGPNVKGFKKGDRVASLIYVPCGECEFCKSGNENLCTNKKTFGEGLDGAYAPYVKVSEKSIVKVPETVPDESAVISACVTGMIYHALKVVGGLKEGEKVLVTGAGGGVGAHSIMIAKALGAEVIAETSSKWKEEKLFELGADHVVYGDDSFDKETKKITNGGVHLALENVGLPTFERTLRALRTAGRMVVVGNIYPEPVNLPLGLIILKGNSIMGSISSTRRDMEAALRLSAEGKIRAVIEKRVPLDAINEAYDEIKGRRVVGRVLIDLK